MADEKKTESGVTPIPGDEKTETKVEPKNDADKRIHELNEESKKHRLAAKAADDRAKASEDKFVAFQKQVGEALGLTKPDETSAAIKTVKDQSEAKSKRILLKSEVTRLVAKDAHDSDDVFRVLDLSGVTVDLDKETVDADDLKSRIDLLKKNKPHLFVSAKLDDKGKPVVVVPAPDKGNPSGNGGSQYTIWKGLNDQGKVKEAREFYSKNQPAILATMPKG